MLSIMREIVAISFFFLLVSSIQAFPGGYTTAYDIVKVQLPRSEWGDAIRAGEFARSLKFPSGGSAENLRSSRIQIAREPQTALGGFKPMETDIPFVMPVPTFPIQSSGTTSISPFHSFMTQTQPIQPAALLRSRPVLPEPSSATQTTSYFGHFFASPHFSFPSQPLFERFY